MRRLELLERNRLKDQAPLEPEIIAGTILNCTVELLQDFNKRTGEQNQEIMNRIVRAGKESIEKTIEEAIEKTNKKPSLWKTVKRKLKLTNGLQSNRT